MALLFFMLVAVQVYFKFQKFTWVQNSMGGAWYSWLLTGTLVVHNVLKIGGRLSRGANMAWTKMLGINNQRVQEVQPRPAPAGTGSLPDAPKETVAAPDDGRQGK